MSKIIGIDLGTSNSAAAYMEAGKAKMIPSAEGTTLVGGKAFPSCVAFTKDGQLLVGEPARRQAIANPEGTVFSVKRKMGTNYKYKIFDKEYTPQQISAFILQKIKKDSELYFGDKVEKAVITVPAYFNDAQRQATKDAGSIAGLEVIRLVNEPTAASFAYGLDKSKGQEQQVLVFDMGAGTLDVTIMNFGGGVFEVISTSGDTKLGGTDMDEALVNDIIGSFKKEQGIDLSTDKMAMQRIKEAAEKAKIELSSTLETEINLPFITADKQGPKHMLTKITRTKLETLVNPIVERCRKSIDQAMKDAKLNPRSVEKVVLVGGPTRMPIVQKFIENIFGDKIARGIDPMECVAMGAAIQAAILGGEEEVKDVLLLDVTPLTLGIETLGGVMTPLIERNTTIPTEKSQIFSTAANNQTSVEIHVLQGERPMASGNRTLGRFILDGIPPSPRGVPQIEVKFDIDASGILTVSAKDKATNKEQHITIKDSSALSKEEIEKMKKDAEKFASEDRKQKEMIDIRNKADNLIYTCEKTIKDAGDKIKPEDKKAVDEKIEELKKVKDGQDLEALKKANQELEDTIQKIGAAMYENAKTQAGPNQSAPSEPNESDSKEEDGSKKKDEQEPIEGEFEEEPKK
ncbi:molecular chaperone DnaK [Candidatus Parcubacteria bacterium 4484_255]|nr:MAG: molecular chaperone DnaK [Candidatus Parcubacteria bacterium 4484_255]